VTSPERAATITRWSILSGALVGSKPDLAATWALTNFCTSTPTKSISAGSDAPTPRYPSPINAGDDGAAPVPRSRENRIKPVSMSRVVSCQVPPIRATNAKTPVDSSTATAVPAGTSMVDESTSAWNVNSHCGKPIVGGMPADWPLRNTQMTSAPARATATPPISASYLQRVSPDCRSRPTQPPVPSARVIGRTTRSPTSTGTPPDTPSR
jgi:hypothetical protein